MKKIKVAQIGTSVNSHGNQVFNSLLKQSDIFEVVGYAFPENERQKFPKQACRFDGYREMTVAEILNDPEIEAVAVETEEIYLTKYAQMVADAGKHLHMEKPGGIGYADFERLIATLREKKLVFSIGYMYRFNPKIKEAIDKVKSGVLGKIFSVEAHMSCKHPIMLREWLGNFPGGMMYFLGCHLVDLIYTIQGTPDEVIPLNFSSGIDGVGSDDCGMAIFKYKNGLSFAKTSANECGGFLRRQLVVTGEFGTIELKPLEAYDEGGIYTVMGECYGDGWLDSTVLSRSVPYDRYDGMMYNFAELIRGKENPYSYEYELELYRLVLKASGVTI